MDIFVKGNVIKPNVYNFCIELLTYLYTVPDGQLLIME